MSDDERSVASRGRRSIPVGKKAGPKNDHFYRAWDSFLAHTPKRSSRTSELAIKANEVRKAAEEDGEGLNTHESVSLSYEGAVQRCKAKVEAIRQECHRLNQKYRDQLFDVNYLDTIQALDGSRLASMTGPCDSERQLPVKRVNEIFADPQFFIDGATADDVVQGEGGDCWFLAALMSISAKPELIMRLCVARDERCGVYGFVFFRDGEWIYEVIDDRLFLRVSDEDELLIVKNVEISLDSKGRIAGYPLGIYHDLEKLRESLQKGGPALYFACCKGNETWLPLIEKAYAKAHGDYKVIEGGWVSEGVEDLTGGVAVTLNPDDIMDRDRFWADLLNVNKTFLFGGSSSEKDQHGIASSHAYTVLQAWEEGSLRLLKIKNPWAEEEWDQAWSDGSEKWTPEMMKKLDHKFGNDGVFWMSYEDFLKHFPAIYRCKLFGPEWTITQHWTSVNVPWIPSYLDTKFEVTVTEKGPVVIVLCQPDRRYFQGLTGRYLYALHFRVYNKQSPDKYLVRSMLNSGGSTRNTRSVSAEVELEPGTYNILLKITATRDVNKATAEEVIQDKRFAYKEKLHTVGRNFEIATTKGLLREKEFADRQAFRDERKTKERAELMRESFKNRSWKRLEKAQLKNREDRKKKAKEARKKDKADKVRTANLDCPEQSDDFTSGCLDDTRPPNVADNVGEQARGGQKTVQDLLQQILDNGRTTDQDLDNIRSLLAGLKLQDGGLNGVKRSLTPAEKFAEQIDDKTDQGIPCQTHRSTEEPLEGVEEQSQQATEMALTTSSSNEQSITSPAVETSTTRVMTAGTNELPKSNIEDEVSQTNQADRCEGDTADKQVDQTTPRSDDFAEPLEPVEHERPVEDGTVRPGTPLEALPNNKSTSETDSSIDDHDFAWDEAIDGPIFMSSDEEPEDERIVDLHADDAWKAICVLGLRVYSICKNVTIETIEGGN